MKVRDVMSRKILSVKDDDTLGLALQTMLWGGVRHLPILREGRVVGILSERDILRRRAEGGDPPSTPVRDVMTRPVETAGSDDSVVEAEARMASARIGCLPVVERGRLVGMLTRTDLLAHHVRQATGETAGAPIARDVMTASPVTAHGDDRLLDAAARMVQKSVRHLPVIDAEGKLLGMLSERDVRTAIGDPATAFGEETKRARIEAMRVADAMVPRVRSVTSDTPLPEVAAALVSWHVGAVPVVDAEQRVIGIVSYVDVLRRAFG